MKAFAGLDSAALEAAAARVAPHVRRTPMLSAASLDERFGATLRFKAEPFQRTGSFKIRGATNAVQSLSEEEARRGVATHSSGNHGAALALAARGRGIPCTVVMPEGAPKVKRDAVAAYGARIVTCRPTQASREETVAAVVEETGATLVHPYDQPAIVAGQSTCARELHEQEPGLDVLLVPVGGGGLVSGTVLATARLAPGCRVIGVEPSGADDARRSLAAGAITSVTPDTVADGLRATIGGLPFAILSEHETEIVTVSDEAIREALGLLWGRLKVVVEPSGAVPFAAVVAGAVAVRGQRVGVILSGGNVDLALASDLARERR